MDSSYSSIHNKNIIMGRTIKMKDVYEFYSIKGTATDNCLQGELVDGYKEIAISYRVIDRIEHTGKTFRVTLREDRKMEG